MIILHLTKKINNLNNISQSYIQKIYCDSINSLDFNTITCSCCSSHKWYIHAYYYRTFSFFNKIRIRVLRIKCCDCGKTHTILIEPLIPFSSVNHDEIIHISNDRDTTSSSHYYHIRRKIIPNDYWLFLRSFFENFNFIILST